jgi:Tol biopolymer transport system component
MGPSYLHGWSPDGKQLAYCAERNGNYDVYVIPAEGGEEVRLTTAEGLDDGPEYSPCGNYIWFNSVRSGLMQVWRMKADGSEQTQLTFDDTRNAWFPHISPDGKQVVYIAYYKGDLKPNEHLANKNVELRIMPAGGGETRTLAKLFGGQGTINVNSWSPDSKKIAFVSYRLK